VIAIIILIVVVILILASCIKIVPQANAYVVERLGAYQGTWEVGIHFKMPIIDRVAKRVLLKEQVVDFAPQPVITTLPCELILSYFSRLQIRSCFPMAWKIRSWRLKI